MPRRLSVRTLIAVLLAALVSAGAVLAARPDAPRAVAERNVLRVLGRDWKPQRIPQLVNARTRLPHDNVQATCRPKPHAKAGVFTCVVRPGRRSDTTRLYISYRQLTPTRFVVHWLDLRR
jgi:hypothetical protein